MEQKILDLQIASLLVIDAEGHILLQHRDGNGAWPYKWSLPGGGVEPGETPEEGARRELEEETGLKVDSALQLFWQGLLPAFSQPGAYRQWHVYTVRTRASQEDIVLGEGLAMVFTAPAAVLELDLTVPSRSILERFLVFQYPCADRNNR